MSVIEEGNGDRTPSKPPQKVPGAVVWVNQPAGALLLKRRVRGAGQHAELLAHKSCRPSGQQCSTQVQLNLSVDRGRVGGAASPLWARPFGDQAVAGLLDPRTHVLE
jgi:hypothetical protein